MAYSKKVRIQASRTLKERGLDAYFSPYEAVWPLIHLEPDIPRNIWEPAAGDGRIVRALRQHNFKVIPTDIADYFTRDISIQTGVNYLEAIRPSKVQGIVTNPPFRLAHQFIKKAISEVPYSAWLLRTNFLESEGRYGFFKENPPARVLISSRRLPMMHQYGWTGKRSTSNTCYAWFIWDANSEEKCRFDWFDWEHYREELITDY